MMRDEGRSIRAASVPISSASSVAEGSSGSASFLPTRRRNSRASSRGRSSMIRKNAGTTTRLRTVETMMPPITAVAIGARNEPPSPTPSAEGSIPADIAIEVMTIGPRPLVAGLDHGRRSGPCRGARISMAKSTSRIAFLVTIPISIRMPISTGIDSGAAGQDQRRRHAADGKRQREQDGEGLDDAERTAGSAPSAPASGPCSMALPKAARSVRPGPRHRPIPCTLTRRRQVDASPRSRLNRAVAVPRATPAGRLAPMVATPFAVQALDRADGPSASVMSATERQRHRRAGRGRHLQRRDPGQIVARGLVQAARGPGSAGCRSTAWPGPRRHRRWWRRGRPRRSAAVVMPSRAASSGRGRDLDFGPRQGAFGEATSASSGSPRSAASIRARPRSDRPRSSTGS